MTGLAQAAAARLGGELHAATKLHGGDLSQVLRITLRDSRSAIAKGGPAPRIEAAMLEAIRAAGVPAPSVLGVDDSVLVLEFLEGAGLPQSAWGNLGTVLARLHATTGRHYGWTCDYAFGPVTIENGAADDWPAFWADRRLRPHLPHLPADLSRRVEALAGDLPNRLPRVPPASLLHGDLWGGNVLAAGGRVTGLIDPACYFGHAEVDIAMLGLFDRPAAAFYDAYGGLEPGSQARLIIYRIWPALVHLRLFGAGYRRMVEGLLTESGV